LFTPTFAVSRVVGWGAHVLEQAAEGRLIRPSARYSGRWPLEPVPVPGRQADGIGGHPTADRSEPSSDRPLAG
jgi:hypothetical protein